MRNAIGFLLRTYSYLFHIVLSLFLIGIALIAGSAGKPLKLEMLPWEGLPLNRWMLVLGVAGLVCVLFAITGLFRYAFPVWALFVFIMMLRGFFFTPYHFTGEHDFSEAAWLTFGALIAFLCSLSLLARRKRKR